MYRAAELYRCDAKPNKLDAGNAHRRRRTKTEFLINNWAAGTLWSDFGVRADIVVSVSLNASKLKLSEIKVQQFTSNFPRTDIHELLTSDLLHQVIKGTFKDHIVMWVNEYLLEVHGEARGLEIIADIDHRCIL